MIGNLDKKGIGSAPRVGRTIAGALPPNKPRSRKLVSPKAKILTAKPVTIWSARNRAVATATIVPRVAPLIALANSPATALWQIRLAIAPPKAPINIIPSIPTAKVPADSESKPPSAAKSRGVAIRTDAGAAIAGLGGAVLSLQELGTFTDGMTNGRGFIALAAIIVGRWIPLRVMLGCLLFGGASALGLNIQGWGLPVSSYIVQMTPYLIALGVLCGIGRKARMPAAIGKPFIWS
jgi:hypothetical protein